LKATERFERQKANISANVFPFEKEVYPLRLSKYGHESVMNKAVTNFRWREAALLSRNNRSSLLSAQASKRKEE